jgi:hypothetical protein
MIEHGEINIDGNKLYEKDLTINQINLYREKLNETTLTDYDINLLHQYVSRYNDIINFYDAKIININDFKNVKLKDIFINSKEDITIANL